VTIRFAGHDFDGPCPAALWIPPAGGGVFAVLIYDAAYKPLPYRAVHFGSATDFSAGRLLASHAKYAEWLAAGRTQWGLYVASYSMPEANALTRLALERYLTHYYHLGENLKI
jgi:hypothetical protein